MDIMELPGKLEYDDIHAGMLVIEREEGYVSFCSKVIERGIHIREVTLEVFNKKDDNFLEDDGRYVSGLTGDLFVRPETLSKKDRLLSLKYDLQNCISFIDNIQNPFSKVQQYEIKERSLYKYCKIMHKPKEIQITISI